jgi:hypothetical protein
MSPRAELLLALDELRDTFVKVQRLMRLHSLPMGDAKRGTCVKTDVWLQRYCNEARNRAYEKWPVSKDGQTASPDAIVPRHD